MPETALQTIDIASQVAKWLGLKDVVSLCLTSSITLNSFSLWHAVLVAEKEFSPISCAPHLLLSDMSISDLRKVAFKTLALRANLELPTVLLPGLRRQAHLVQTGPGTRIISLVPGMGLAITYRSVEGSLYFSLWNLFSATQHGTVQFEATSMDSWHSVNHRTYIDDQLRYICPFIVRKPEGTRFLKVLHIVIKDIEPQLKVEASIPIIFPSGMEEKDWVPFSIIYSNGSLVLATRLMGVTAYGHLYTRDASSVTQLKMNILDFDAGRGTPRMGLPAPPFMPVPRLLRRFEPIYIRNGTILFLTERIGIPPDIEFFFASVNPTSSFDDQPQIQVRGLNLDMVDLLGAHGPVLDKFNFLISPPHGQVSLKVLFEQAKSSGTAGSESIFTAVHIDIDPATMSPSLSTSIPPGADFTLPMTTTFVLETNRGNILLMEKSWQTWIGVHEHLDTVIIVLTDMATRRSSAHCFELPSHLPREGTEPRGFDEHLGLLCLATMEDNGEDTGEVYVLSYV